MRTFEISYGSAPIVVHIPHAGSQIPPSFDRNRLVDPDAFDATVAGVRDVHAVWLGRELAVGLSATVMSSSISRCWCDVERWPDGREEMNASGMGVIYERDMFGHDIYRPDRAPDANERADRMRTLYHPWHRILSSIAAGMLADYGVCTLIDTHTYPKQPHAGELHATEPRPDVDLGHNGDPASVALAAGLATHLLDAGLTVGVNACYKGSMIPNGVVDDRLRSVMLEVRRDVAADPDNRRLIVDAVREVMES